MKLLQLLKEITLDSFTDSTSKSILSYLQSTNKLYKLGKETEIGPKNSSGYYIKKFKVFNDPLLFTLFIGIKRDHKIEEFETNASTETKNDSNEVLITIKINPVKEPNNGFDWDFNHLTNNQEDKQIRDKINKLGKDKYKYFLLPDEIPAMIKGMKLKAKNDNKPLKDVFDEYLQKFVDDNTITKDQKNLIIKRWLNEKKWTQTTN